MAVHRFKVGESGSSKTVDDTPQPVKAAAEKTKKPARKQLRPEKEKTSSTERPNKFLAPFRAMKNYFVGSWHELRQVRWPNRKQTWSLTLAVIVFSLLFGLFIFLIDFLFVALFKYIIS